jgi:hypothetical protein
MLCSVLPQLALESFPCAQVFHGQASAEHLPSADRLESVLEVLDRGKPAVIGPDDRDDVEPARMFEQGMALEEVERGEGEPSLLLLGDGLGRFTSAAGLDLDEDESVAVAGDQVDFSSAGPVAPDDDPKAVAAEELGGGPLAPVPEPPAPEGSEERCSGRTGGPAIGR